MAQAHSAAPRHQLDLVVADSCQDGNAWCRDDPYSLDQAEAALNSSTEWRSRRRHEPDLLEQSTNSLEFRIAAQLHGRHQHRDAS